MKHARPILLVLVFLAFGCCAAQAQSESEMQQLASDLTQLSPAVEAAVHYDPSTADLSDDELLKNATRTNPEKLAPFVGYTLVVDRQAGHAAVLVCTKDGRKALLEDAGCTFRLEAHHWRATPELPCKPTLNLKEVCPGPN